MKRLLLAVVLLAAGCSGQEAPAGDEALVVVSAPLSSSPWVGRNAERGARLAAQQLGPDDAGGRRLRVEVLDNGGSAQRAAAAARTAVERDAVAMVVDGVGAAAVAEVTDPAALPVFVVFEGGEGLIDAQERPTLFRLAPANRPMSRRLADYVSEKADRIAVLGDTSSYGAEGVASTRQALARNEVTVTTVQSVPEGASDVAAQVLAARRSRAEALVVWARPATVAAVVRAARGSGWDVPVFSGPTAEDPLVRQRLADRPQWLRDVYFVSFRITSEVGPEPFAAFREAYEAEYGEERVVGDVVQPPDWAMYSYDAVRLVAAGLERTGGRAGRPLLDALEQVVITGANGDERGYGETDREGVSPDDMYFARFEGMRFVPVDDDVLSTNLPPVEQ